MYKDILLIDDNDTDHFINSRLITSFEICETIHSFLSAKSALLFLKNEKIVKRNPSLIFLDVDMPEMNGFGFLKEFSKLPNSIIDLFKIIMLSSTINPDDIQKGNEHPHVFKFISKPLTVEFLLLMQFHLLANYPKTIE
jgi:CheY-like chemotaxis protein